MSEYIDVGRVLTLAQLQAIKAARPSVVGILPYLDPFNPKGCTPQYLRDIATVGLRVAGFFYETTGGAGDPAYFSEAQGKHDAAFAETLLASFGDLVPKGVIVWYAADINIEPASFTPYANGIASIASAAQTPGLYGYQRLCDYARTAYPAFGTHLAQTYGAQATDLEVWQHQQLTIAGITVDLDDVAVLGWVPGGDYMAFADDPDAQFFKTDTDNSILAIKDALTGLANAILGLGSLEAADAMAVKTIIDKLHAV